MLQQTVLITQGFSVVGEIYTNSPSRAEVYTLNSLDPANNVFGRAFTKTLASPGYAEAGGTGVFAGFLINPKSSASFGTVTGGALAPTLTLPNQSFGEIMNMGTIVVSLPAAANIGDYICYDLVTGELTSQPPASAPLLGTAFAHAVVDYFQVSSAGLAVITITDVPLSV